MPVGLIVNEALTNAMKYAFAGRESGRVTVTLEPVEKDYARLRIADDRHSATSNLIFYKPPGSSFKICTCQF